MAGRGRSRRSRPAAPPLRRPLAGFTLLELLIVIFIVSLISAGFVRLMVGFGGAALSLEEEARRLHRLLTLAAQQAILQGSEIGLLVEADGYHFVRPVKDYSVALREEELLRHRKLPEGWRLELEQDDRPVPPVTVAAEKEGAEQETRQPPPSILFYDSGEVTPFRLHLYTADASASATIEARENGEIEMRLEEPAR